MSNVATHSYTYTLYVKIVQECIATNELKPEYEMWLRQEFINSDNDEKFYRYLLSLTPDTNGWIYWFLSEINIWHYDISEVKENNGDNNDGDGDENNDGKGLRRKIRFKYLQKSVECNHKIAQCEYLYNSDSTAIDEKFVSVKDNITKLQFLFNSGNYRAAAYIYTLVIEDHEDEVYYEEYKALSYKLLYKGVEQGDFCCSYIAYTNFETNSQYHIDGVIRIAGDRCLRWGYHSNFLADFNPYELIHPDELKDVGKRLIDLGIPCGYCLMGFITKSDILEKINNFGKGMECECSACLFVIEQRENYKIMYKLLSENKELKKLQSCSLEDVVKNVISEYIQK
jgi:hypothetical protein